MLNQDFKEIISAFNAAGVEYMVVGAYAVAAHGLPRATGDIDLWVRPTQDNAVEGVDFDSAWSERLVVTMDGVQVNVIGRDHLLQKQARRGAAPRRSALGPLDPTPTLRRYNVATT